ncbi:UNVERIFIED_ORG: hypothetical protein J2W85_000773 [Ensifer adhaerens]|nr:hypothetical protein [Ensifer adhaerens]
MASMDMVRLTAPLWKRLHAMADTYEVSGNRSLPLYFWSQISVSADGFCSNTKGRFSYQRAKR